MERPRLEDLTVVQASRMWAHVDEKTGEEMLERAEERGGHAYASTLTIMSLLGKIAAKTALFVVDYETIEAASASACPGFPELPPLPFPHIIVETSGSETFSFGDRGDELPPEITIEAFAIDEIEPGQGWVVYLFICKTGEPRMDWFPGLPSPWSFQRMAVTPAGAEFVYTHAENEEIPMDAGLVRVIVETVHLIGARGVCHEDISGGRAERRRAARAGEILPPHLYWVDIDGGRVRREPEEPSGREYHCRWLVRGHWRHIKTKRTWVRAHIKGPAGAPWRGRPVYGCRGILGVRPE